MIFLMRSAIKRLLRYVFYAAAALLALIFFVNLAVYTKARPHIYKSSAEVPKAQAVLIPGASVVSGYKLSPLFEDRVKAAIALYRAGKAEKILVSGDNSTVYYNEVNPVRNYLLAEGIPEDNIFLDHAGFDTYSSMYRAKEIFEAGSVIVVSQAFHLPRAVFIARALGLEAYGFAADSGRVALKNYIREALASEKAVLDVILSRKPKYLGEAIPLSGSGLPASPAALGNQGNYAP